MLIPDKSLLHHGAFHGQDHDAWYYKMYFDMLKVIFRPDARYRIYLDIKDTCGAQKAAKLHEVLCNDRYDFIDSKPVLQGRRLGLKRHPMTQGKEATFWHLIQERKVEEERNPDFRRCERIRWPKPIIERDTDPVIKIWRNRRRRKERVCLWLVQENYLVILADRGENILPWTAYLVEQSHRQRKLQREYEEHRRKQSSKR